MHVRREISAQTHDRLLCVLAQAELSLYPGVFTQIECPVATFPIERIGEALAFVRDEDGWSALVPADLSATEPVRIFAFHFPPGLDNSGFVGWLATHLKATLGTGVLVVFGHNSARGGIFDYWGVPTAIAETALTEIHRLRLAGLTLVAGLARSHRPRQRGTPRPNRAEK
jgi:hypothetical protein